MVFIGRVGQNSLLFERREDGRVEKWITLYTDSSSHFDFKVDETRGGIPAFLRGDIPFEDLVEGPVARVRHSCGIVATWPTTFSRLSEEEREVFQEERPVRCLVCEQLEERLRHLEDRVNVAEQRLQYFSRGGLP